LIDAYAATSPAEFFAVVSEVFFEQPVRLASAEQALYAELRDFYKLDPALW
jgi:Mlc titration factor MtfA (ptsG expression regulator)